MTRKEIQKAYRARKVEDNPNYYRDRSRANRKKKLAQDPEYHKKRHRVKKQVRAEAYQRRKARAKTDLIFALEQRDKNLRKKYGITVEDYEQMWYAQDGKCAICGRSPEGGKLYIDHCHKTNVVRGLLCISCNVRLSIVDDHLSSVVAYLKRSITRRVDLTAAPSQIP